MRGTLPACRGGGARGARASDRRVGPRGRIVCGAERAVLAAANDACRLALETTLQAVARPDQVRVDGVLYERHHEGTVVYRSLCGPPDADHARYAGVRTTHDAAHAHGGDGQLDRALDLRPGSGWCV